MNIEKDVLVKSHSCKQHLTQSNIERIWNYTI